MNNAKLIRQVSVQALLLRWLLRPLGLLLKVVMGIGVFLIAPTGEWQDLLHVFEKKILKWHSTKHVSSLSNGIWLWSSILNYFDLSRDQDKKKILNIFKNILLFIIVFRMACYTSIVNFKRFSVSKFIGKSTSTN